MKSTNHDEKRIPLGKAHLAVDFPTSPATLWRWWLKGRNGIRLETVLIGGRRYTTLEAIDRFIAGCNQPQAAASVAPCRDRSRQMEIAAKRAETIF